MKTIQIGFTICVLAFLAGCSKSSIDETWEGLKFPAHFPPPVYEMKDNPVTKEGFELGKKIFYDPILSRDNTISCGSCHIQSSAFTHHGHDLSHGINDQLGKRNALPIQNLLWQTSFFWDGGVHNIDLISLNPIQNPVEMDEDPQLVLLKLKNHAEYPALFKKAFGTEEINTARFLQALSQFMAMLISSNSKYDQYKRGELSLSSEEMEGLQIFKSKCSHCHAGELFTDNSFRNNGLSSQFNFDKGRYEISLIPSDIGKFKVPSLRNIALTAPYMHHGQIGTLEGVLDHYALNVKNSSTLDSSLISNQGLGINLDAQEKKRIVSFLNTLTDETFIKNTHFSE